jgi:hypothetical protein
MRIITELKELLYQNGVSLTYIANELGKKLNKNYTLANLSNKLRRETITHKEIKIIAEILGYDFKFIKKD